jgi:hypothetical protein
VQNGDDVYTVDAVVFARTYERIGAVEYRKSGTVWAEEAKNPGSIDTKKGKTHYAAGDFIVYNDRAQTDGYAITAPKFRELYVPVSEGRG